MHRIQHHGLTALLATTLVACGGGGEDTSTTSAGLTVKPAEASAAAPAPPAASVAVDASVVTPTVDPATLRASPTAYAGYLGTLLGAFKAVTQTLSSSASNFLNGPQTATAIIQRASCGAGSQPETGLQGQVPLADRKSGRSQQGYSCNMELVGQYQGEGATWVNPFYDKCAYMATSFNGIPFKRSQGVQVVDVSDTRNPKFSTNLTSPAFFTGTWETLKVNDKRGLLGGVAVGPAVAAAFFDVYDISDNCAKPVLANSFSGNLTLPANVLGHEGNWSPDGLTYWASGLAGGSLTAIDVTNPKKPRIVYTGTSVVVNHGFELSEDGNRLYLSTAFPAGLVILDVSDVQARKAVPIVRQVGSVFWNTAGVGQHTIPVTMKGKPYLVAVDEFAAESVKFIDISDETKPRVVAKLQLEIHLPQHANERLKDVTGNGLFGYEAHYCSVDRRIEPTAMACGFFQSGVRVFDIRDPSNVKEIAYFNPPAQVGKAGRLHGSEHTSLVVGNIGGLSASDAANLNQDSVPTILTRVLANPLALGSNLTADYCSSPPKFVGSDQLWVTCQDNGVMVLKFKNAAYPL
ncbi:MAG: hypothetical protein V4738_11280 [Pseudomonadota bacterium]